MAALTHRQIASKQLKTLAHWGLRKPAFKDRATSGHVFHIYHFF